MSYFVEVRPLPKRVGRVKLVRLEDVGNYTGFRSVYAYSADTAALIEDEQSTRSLRGVPVYSDTVFVDFDDTDSSDFKARLIAAGLAFDVFDSGNRSVHYHVKYEPKFGSGVPAAQKAWVADLSNGKADVSFYHTAGQFRLVGTPHSKTGRIKTLTERHTGKALSLVEKEVPPPIALDQGGSEERLGLLITACVGVGHRSAHCFKIAICAVELGRSFDEVMYLLQLWNANQTAPHSEHTLERHCRDAFQRAARRAI